MSTEVPAGIYTATVLLNGSPIAEGSIAVVATGGRVGHSPTAASGPTR